MFKLGFECIECNKSFEVPERIFRAKKTKRSFKFCSKECYITFKYKNRQGGVFICETCKKEFFVNAARVRQTAKNGNQIRFCSMPCYAEGKKGDKNPMWGKKMPREVVARWLNNPNRHIFSEGKNNPNYKIWEQDPYKRKHPGAARSKEKHGVKSCSRCGWDIEPAIFQVHHKDRNHNNNEKINLEVLCPNCHEMEHFNSGDGRWRMKRQYVRKAPRGI